MNVRRLVISSAALAIVSMASNARALIIIPTNQGAGSGLGADAEVREDDFAVGLGGDVTGTNRGASTELATRGNNTTATATGDRSSVMYMKFDITGLPAANDPFWADKEVVLRGNIRNSNLPLSRLFAVKPNGNQFDPNDFVLQKFDVRGLEPSHTYADDNASAANRTDRSGNGYVDSEYKYNWSESAITFYNAPGVTPHCMLQGSCETATYGGTVNDVNQSLGLFDDFNSDVRLLGTYAWPGVNPQNHLPIGKPIDFVDTDVKQLILDAKAAGRSTVTLMLHMSASVSTQNPSSGGTQTPSSLLGFNYLWIPKDMNPLTDDNGYDPNTANPNFPADPLGDKLGSPYSCTFDATNRPQCTGVGNNSTGDFSPKLIIRVPEPASMGLVALGLFAALGLVRRRGT